MFGLDAAVAEVMHGCKETVMGRCLQVYGCMVLSDTIAGRVARKSGKAEVRQYGLEHRRLHCAF